jgi:hypothetical protein
MNESGRYLMTKLNAYHICIYLRFGVPEKDIGIIYTHYGHLIGERCLAFPNWFSCKELSGFC